MRPIFILKLIFSNIENSRRAVASRQRGSTALRAALPDGAAASRQQARQRLARFVLTDCARLEFFEIRHAGLKSRGVSARQTTTKGCEPKISMKELSWLNEFLNLNLMSCASKF